MALNIFNALLVFAFNIIISVCFLPSNNYKHFINVECQFSFVKFKHLNKFQGAWGCIINEVPLNSDAGDEGRALGTDFVAVAL